MNCIDYAFKNTVDDKGNAIFSKREIGDMLRVMEHIANTSGDKAQAIDKINKYTQIKTLVKQKELQERFDNSEKLLRIESKIVDYSTNKKVKSPVLEAMTAMAEGSNIPGLGAKFSVASLNKVKAVYLREILTFNIESQNLKEFTSMKHDANVARALYDLQTTGKVNPINGVDGHTMNKITQLATVYEKFNSAVIKTLRGSGIYVGEIAGYLGRQMHSTEKIIAAGKDKWKAAIINRLDQEKTFGEHAGNTKEMNGILDTIYEHITNGEGTYTLSKFNKSRQLHFKSPENWISYSQEFAVHDNLFDNLMHSVRGVARISSIVDVFGTSYKETLSSLRARLKPVDRTKFDDMVHSMYGFDEFTGASKLAEYSALTRAVMNSAKLMNTVFQAFNDNVTMGLAMKHVSGEWMPVAWAKALSQTLTDLVPTNQRAEFLAGVGVDSEFSSSMFISRILGGENVGKGVAAKINNWTYKWNFTRHWTAAAKHTVAKNVLGSFNTLINKKSLDPRDVTFLKQYDISADDLKAYKAIFDSSKDTQLSVDTILKSDDASFLYGANQGETYKTKLAFKLSNMINQVVEFGVPTPGKKESRQLFRLEDPDTLRGQFVRFATQFKLTPMKQMNTMMFLARLEGGALPIGYLVGRTAAMGFASYWIADTAKKMIRGDDTWQRDLSEYTPAEIGGYITRGGGFGLIADSLAGVIQSPYMGAKHIVGPLGSNIIDVASIFKAGSEGKSVDKKTVNTIINNLPAVNHPASVIMGIRQGMKDGMIDMFNF